MAIVVYAGAAGMVLDATTGDQKAVISVVPIRAGSGTRLKILESMALGRAVVSTTLGCEGLAVTEGENILTGDSPTDFGNQVIRLMNDRQLRRRLIAGGRQLVETTYDWRIIASRLLQVYEEVVEKNRMAPTSIRWTETQL